MRATWEVLRLGGIPLAGSRGAIPSSPVALAEAARVAVAHVDAESAREHEALGAWLRAGAWHWPSSFAESFGADADRMLVWARAATPDHGRYLKLRRMATANLAKLL